MARASASPTGSRFIRWAMVVLGTCFVVVVVNCLFSRPNPELNAIARAAEVYHEIQTTSAGSSSLMPHSRQPIQFSNSTEYFRALIGRGDTSIRAECFVPMGLIWWYSTVAILERDNNLWCIVLDVDATTQEKTPVMFTKNLAIESLDKASADQVDQTPLLGSRCVLVIRKDGTSDRIEPSDIAKRLNSDGATNRVLRP